MKCSTTMTSTRAISTGRSEPISGRRARSRCVLTLQCPLESSDLCMASRTAGEAINAPQRTVPNDECDTDAHSIVVSTSLLAASAPNVKRGKLCPFHSPRLKLTYHTEPYST